MIKKCTKHFAEHKKSLPLDIIFNIIQNMKKSVDMIPKNLSSIAPFLVIDVRQDEEVLNQPILGEYKHIKMDELLNNSNLIDPKQNVVFVCAAGIRSKYVAEIFRSNGFFNAYSLSVGVTELNEFYLSNNNKYI